LASVTIGNNVNTIGSYAFEGCYGLSSVTIPNSVTTIRSYAFGHCGNLTAVTIGSGVTNIGDYAFASCFGGTESLCLRGVYFQGNAPSYVGLPPFNGDNETTVYYLAGATGWGTTFGGRPAMVWNPQLPFLCTTNSGTITITRFIGPSPAATIPDAIGGLPVIAIGTNAFANCYALTNVAIGHNVNGIGTNAFTWCSRLTSVIIPDSVTSLGDFAFYYCTRLANVVIGNSVTNIGSRAFLQCYGLTNVTIGNSVTSIEYAAFASCEVLASVTIPNSVTNIGTAAFTECYSLANVRIGNGVTCVGANAFDSCTSLTNVTIPNSVTSIGAEAFFGSGLTSVMIGNSVTNIEQYAFFSCTNLTGVYFRGNAPSLSSSGVFRDDAHQTTVYYLPRTTGWYTPFGGLPAVLWTPQVQTLDVSFGVRTDEFGFNVSWASGMVVVVEACTNLANHTWLPLRTNTFGDGPLYFSDPQWTNYPARLYRIRWP
jgi:hypothetical protein